MRGVRWFGLVVLAGCAGESSGGGAIAVRDSAGIEIVEHPSGYEASLPVWSLGAPLLDIGGREEPGHDLFRVGGGARLADGRIVVINRGSGELRVFDSAGRYQRAIGRRGEGPGEFSNAISWIQVLPGDTLFVLDGQYERGTFFAPSGEFIRIVPAGYHREGSGVRAIGRLADGRLLAADRRFPSTRENDGPVRRDPFAIVVIRPGVPALDTVAVVPDQEIYPTIGFEGGQQFPTIQAPEFGRTTDVATDGRWVIVGTNEPGGIRVYDPEGRLVRLIRSLTPQDPVTVEDRDRRKQENLKRLERQRASEQVKSEWIRNEASRRFATVFPYHERVMPGRDGTIWLERARRYDDEGRRFVVYDSLGRAIATVRCPDRMRPYQVGPSEVIGLWRDPDDVEHVRVYPVIRDR